MSIDVLDGIEKIIDNEKLGVFNMNLAGDIIYLAKGLNRAEILAYYGAGEETMTDEDKKLLDLLILRSKTAVMAQATENLIGEMKGKQTIEATMIYLRRFGADWNTVDDMAGEGKFSFSMGAK